MNQLQTWLIKRFGPACVAGITFRDWIGLLSENRFRISPRYWGKVPAVSVSSVCSSAFAIAERAVYRSRLTAVDVSPPLFIVGSWRSGTTFLHTLLCCDSGLSSPNMFQTMYPHTFLLNESWLRPLLQLGTPRRRFMDNMVMNLREPHEDEMALAIMSRRSNMLSWAFPQNAEVYDRFLDFHDTTDEDRRIWKACFEHFVRKVTLRTGTRLVLKSPNHTARARLLLELFPGARFLHIHRNPYDVFRSMVHMATQVTPVWGLQWFPPEEIPAMVIDTYRRLYDAWFDQKHEIPSGQLFELPYEDFTAAPVESLERAYGELGLEGFDAARPALLEHTSQKKSYRKNKHTDLAAEDCTLINEKWGRAFEQLGYDMRHAPVAAGKGV